MADTSGSGSGQTYYRKSDPVPPLGAKTPVTLGIVIIILFFGVFGGWAAIAPLQSAAVAPGVVNVETKRKTVQHLEGGIIEKVLVRDGDVVNAGQPLVILDKTQTRMTLDILKGRFWTAKALQARLIAERDRQGTILFPPQLLDRRDNPEIKEMMEGQSNIFDARHQADADQIAIYRQHIAQNAAEVKGLKGQIAAQENQLRLIEEEIADVNALFKKGVASKSVLLALLRRKEEIKGSRSRNLALIAQSQQIAAETKILISQLRTKRLNEAVEQLQEAQNEIHDLEERIHASKDILSRTVIRAPIEGTIVGLQVHTPGGVISPGAPLMDIIPNKDRLIIEAHVDANDIDVVHPGLMAQIRFSAFSQRNILPIEGKVISVSADRLIDDRSGQAYYLTQIELAEDPSIKLDGASIGQGMAAEVMIITGKRTAFDYLMQPIARTFERSLREN